jgi:hypothetical protein
MNKLTITTSLLVLSFILYPFTTNAQDVSDLSSILGSLPGPSIIKAGSAAIDKIPSVPVNDLKHNAKDSGISIFGINIGISWNQLALNAGKAVVNSVVKSTIDWMNRGFDGSPAYVTDPGGYFANIADGVAGDFIKGGDLGFLCSPIQAQVRLSLKKYYSSTYVPQCTLSKIGVNLENFYEDFSQGGWDAWREVTQIDSNNPYGAYLAAQVEIDNRVVAAVGDKKAALDWGQGFKSVATCAKRNASTDDLIKWQNAHPNDSTIPPNYNPNYGPGVCIQEGAGITPGATVKSHLDAILPGNNYIKQLTSADQFDQLFTALYNGFMQKFAYGKKGLLDSSGSKSNSGSAISSAPIEQPAQCSPSADRALVNSDKITWTAGSNFAGPTDFIWSGSDAPGDNALSATAAGPSASIVYTTPGTKTATVTASTTEIDEFGNFVEGTHKMSIPVPCGSSVTVGQYQPLALQCSPTQNTTTHGSMITWRATATGGSGEFAKVQWGGDETSIPGTHVSILPPIYLVLRQNLTNPSQEGSQVTRSGNKITVDHPYQIGGGTAHAITTFTQNASSTEITLERRYDDQSSIPGERSANITLIDMDQSLPVLVNQSCSQNIYVSD